MRPIVTARDLAWGFKSPSGAFPYLAMLHAYMDESGHEAGPLCVLAGFIGTDVQWESLALDWKKGLGAQRQCLHMTDLRWSRAVRTQKLLSTLGPIPYEHGLSPVIGIVGRAAYNETVGKVQFLAPQLTPLVCAFKRAVVGIARSIPKNESVKLTFERQDRMSPLILNVYNLIKTNYPDITNRIVGIDFVEKCKTCFTEPADYLAFQLREYYSSDAGKPSVKAVMGMSILGDPAKVEYIGGVYSFEDLRRDAREIATNTIIKHARRIRP